MLLIIDISYAKNFNSFDFLFFLEFGILYTRIADARVVEHKFGQQGVEVLFPFFR